MRDLRPGRIEIWSCWFLWREENQRLRRKILGASREPTTNSPVGIEPAPFLEGGERNHHFAIPAPQCHNLRGWTTCLYYKKRYWLIFFVSLQWWVWFAINANHRHGIGVEQQLKHAILTIIDAARSTIKSATSKLFSKTASAKLIVLTRPAIIVNELMSVSSTAVMETTATLALSILSAVSCSWHALWYLWWLLSKLEIKTNGKTGTTHRWLRFRV